jgi:hypothetical protein
MPPRHTYWTIILEGQPTAFRAHTQEELLPTLRQLQARHPTAVMLWFARGKLWQSPEEARDAFRVRRKPDERRGPDWRPGGTHQDPRDRFKVPRDEKRRRFKERLYRDRSAPKEGEGRPSRFRPGGRSSSTGSGGGDGWKRSGPPRGRPGGAGRQPGGAGRTPGGGGRKPGGGGGRRGGGGGPSR